MVLMVWLLRANTAKPVSYVGEKEVSCDRCPYVTLGSPLCESGIRRLSWCRPIAASARLASGDAGTRLHDFGLALQLPFMEISESMGNHDSKIVDAASVD